MSSHKSRQTKRIVEAALRVIHAEGLSNVSVSKVAAEAGVTRQTFYSYYSGIHGIVAQIMVEHSAETERQLLAVIKQAEGPFEKLRAFAGFQLSHATLEHAFLDLEAGLSAQARSQLAAHTGAVKSALEQVISSGFKGRSLAGGLEPRVASELLWGMVEGAMGAALMYPEQVPQLRDAVVNAMWVAISPQR